VEAAEALEEVADLVVFEEELGGVGEVLVLAAAAIAEVGAGRLDAVGGGAEDFEDAGAGVVFLHLGQFDAELFAGGGEGDEHDELVDATDGIAAVGDGVDGEFDLLAWGVGDFARHGSGGVE
jgi:hypothetical protein